MYQEHKPFKCPACGDTYENLWIHEGYYTDTGDGFCEIKCSNCDYELTWDEIERVGMFRDKGSKLKH